MYSFSEAFAPLRGDICGFSSTPLTSPVKKRRKRNRRFSEFPVKLKAGTISPTARREARKRWRSCLASNSLSFISFLEETGVEEEPESSQYWATNELENESLGQLSYSAIEPNLEIIKERIIWLRDEEPFLNDSSTDEETYSSGYIAINHYMDDISYLSEDERYARIDDENISTTDDSKNISTIESVGKESVFIFGNKNHLADDQMLKWMKKIVIKVT